MSTTIVRCVARDRHSQSFKCNEVSAMAQHSSAVRPTEWLAHLQDVLDRQSQRTSRDRGAVDVAAPALGRVRRVPVVSHHAPKVTRQTVFVQKVVHCAVETELGEQEQVHDHLELHRRVSDGVDHRLHCATQRLETVLWVHFLERRLLFFRWRLRHHHVPILVFLSSSKRCWLLTAFGHRSGSSSSLDCRICC